MATWPTITDDDGSNTVGTVLNNTNVWTPIQSYIGGAWTNVTFSAGDFAGGPSGTWTVGSGDVTVFKYVEIGKTMLVSFVILTSTVASGPTRLRFAIPNGRTCVGIHYSTIVYSDNGTVGYGYAVADANIHTDNFFCQKVDASAWAASTNNTNVIGSLSFEIA
jgi:hypothetical protein